MPFIRPYFWGGGGVRWGGWSTSPDIRIGSHTSLVTGKFSDPQEFQVPKMKVLNLFSAVLGMEIPLHKPYPYSLYDGEDEPSILGTNEMLGEQTAEIESLKNCVS